MTKFVSSAALEIAVRTAKNPTKTQIPANQQFAGSHYGFDLSPLVEVVAAGLHGNVP
jgi:hypothetical protein